MNQFRIFPVFVFLCLSLFNAIPAQESTVSHETDPEYYQFRRIFFPEDRLKEVVVNLMGDDPYCPIPAATFQQWIELTQNQEHAVENSNFISSIHLSASLEGSQMIDGKGIVQFSDRDGEESQMLSLEPFGLAISSPKWSDGTEAELGLFSRGGIGLLASPRFSTLSFDWSMKGKTDSKDNILFVFELPASPSTELVLDIPHHMKPAMTNDFDGLIRQVTEDSQTVRENYRRWQIVFGSHNKTAIQILYDETLITPQQQIALSQTNQYEISLRGLSLQTIFTFENTNTPLGEVLLTLDSPLHPIQLEYNGKPVSWSKIVSDDGNSSENLQISAVLPAATNNQNELRLTAYCPVTVEKLWKLPRIRLSSKRVFWMETRNQIHVLHPLKTRSIRHPELRETSPMTGVDFSDNELFAFQAYHCDAQISMHLSFETPRLHWQCGAMIEWTEQDVISKMIVDLSVNEGNVRQLEMQLSPQWSLDTLNASKPAQIGDFFTQKNSVGTDEGNLWIIQLNQPIDPQNPLRLVLNARCSRAALPLPRTFEAKQTDPKRQSPQTSFALNDLIPIRFQHGQQGKCLLALENRFRYNISPTEISPSEIIGRFETMPNGIVLSLDSCSGIPVTMEPVFSTYQMNVTTQILVNRDSLDQICHFTCIPQNNSRLRQVQVQFTPSTATQEWIWSDAPDSSDTSHIRTIPADDGLGDKWLIEPSVPRSTSFEFYAKRTIPFQDAVEVSLPVFSSPENAAAFVSIEVQNSSGYRLHEHQMYATPISPESPHTPQIQAFYGYHPRPGQIHSIKMEPDLSDQQILQLSCIWSMVIQTRHDSIGNTINHVVYSLENQGIDHLEVTLPHGVAPSSVHAIWIDGHRSSWHAEPKGKQIVITVPLLEKKRFSLIEVEYFLKSSPLQSTTVVSPSVPKVNIPVISQSWIAWFSPVFHAYHGNSRERTSPFLSYLIAPSSLDAFNLTKWHHWLFEKQHHEKLLAFSKKIIKAVDHSQLGGTSSNPNTVTWKEFLEMPQYAPKTFLIDETSLSRIGIFASDPVPLESDAMKAFEQNGLVWVFDDYNTLLLTSNYLMAQLRDHSYPIFGDRFYHYKGASLQKHLGTMPKPHRTVSLGQWEKISFPNNSPWICPESLIRFESATPLWNAYEQHWEEDSPPSLVVVYKNRILACQYLSFLLVVALTWPRRFNKTKVYFLLFLVIFLAMFLLPAWWHDIIYGLFWGMICSMSFALLRVSREPAQRKIRLLKRVNPPNTDNSGLSHVVKSLLFAVVFCAQPWFVQANEPAEPETSTFTPYHVYIPYDQESGNVAEYYYIPDKFYRRLHQAYQNSRFSQHNWQITSAKYQGTFINDTLFNLKVTLDIELPDQSCVFRLPPMPLRPDGANLDKQPIQTTLDPKTQEHIFEISGSGSHQLELILTPKIIDDPLARYFEIPIPPVSDSVLELTFPSEVPRVRIQDAKGRISSEAGTLTAELGPIDTLLVSWPPEMITSTQSALAVTQLLYLKALPNQVDLKIMFKFHIPKERRSQVLLAVDPRFQLSGKYRCNDVIIDHEVDAKQPALHRILVDPTISGEVVLQADYILNNFSGGIFSGIGQIRYPRFSIVDARIHRSWLGVSVDPSLEATVPEPTIISRAFKDTWGKPDDHVAYAYDLNLIDPTWVMQIRQKPIHFFTAIDQKLLFQNQKAVSEVKMQISSERETYFFSIATPKQFQMNQVSVRDEKGVLRDAPRAVHDDQILTLFFERPLVGTNEITLNGEISYALNHSIDFPRFHPKHGDVVSQHARLYRDFTVLVDQKLQEGCYEQMEIPFSETSRDPFFASSMASPLCELKILDQERFQGSTLLVRPNQPEIVGTQILQIDQDPDNEQWETLVTLDLHISQGALDQLKIFYPTDIVSDAPSLVDTPALAIDPPKDSQGILSLKPNQNTPLTGYQKIKIRFPTKGSSDSVLLKPIRLLNDNKVQNYVALVTQAPMKEMLWTVGHMEQIPTIPGFTLDSSTSALQKKYEYYHTTDQNYYAEISIKKNHPVVLCHDVSFFLAKNDDCYGISLLDIQNHENNFCFLRLPGSGRLLQVKTGGMTIIPEKIDEDSYRIELWPHMPVQRIEVFFTTQPSMLIDPEENWMKKQNFSIPQIENVPLQRLFWSFFMEQKITSGYENHFIQLMNVAGQPVVADAGNQKVSLDNQGLRAFRCQMNLLRLHNNLELFQKFPLNRDTTNRELADLALLREKEWNKILHETELLCSHVDVNSSKSELVLTSRSTPLFQKITQNDKNINAGTSQQPVIKDLMPYLQGIEQPSSDYIKQLETLYFELPFNKNHTPISDKDKNTRSYEPDTASLFFRNQSDHFLFAGGAGSQPITQITLVSVHGKTPFLEKRPVKHVFFFLVVSGLFLACNAKFFKDLFIASPAFLVIAVGILVLVFTNQQFLGWCIVLLVLLATYFPLFPKKKK